MINPPLPAAGLIIQRERGKTAVCSRAQYSNERNLKNLRELRCFCWYQATFAGKRLDALCTPVKLFECKLTPLVSQVI